MKELNAITKDSVKRIKRLGTFSSDTLAKGYKKAEHEDELTALLVYLGRDFPIPVLEMALKTMRANLNDAKKTIQEQMLANEIDNFSMNGLDFDVKTTFTPEFPLDTDGKPDKQAFYQWCIDNNKGQVVKSNIALNKVEDAQLAIAALNEFGLHGFQVEREVHHKTLEKLVREMVEGNEEMPPKEIMNVNTYDVLIMKEKK